MTNFFRWMAKTLRVVELQLFLGFVLVVTGMSIAVQKGQNMFLFHTSKMFSCRLMFRNVWKSNKRSSKRSVFWNC